jgi:hypothetical protein
VREREREREKGGERGLRDGERESLREREEKGKRKRRGDLSFADFILATNSLPQILQIPSKTQA